MCPAVIGSEGRVIFPDRMGEVSRGHIRRSDTDSRQCLYGRIRNPSCISKEQMTETLGLSGQRLKLCRLRRPERYE